MTRNEWLAQAARDADKLRSLLREYHPVMLARHTPTQRLEHAMPITAPGAEAACAHVRGEIQRNFEGDPVAQFDEALAAGDVGKVSALLDDAWFGVPESTQCWRVDGFRQAVDLLDDPPDEEDANG